MHAPDTAALHGARLADAELLDPHGHATMLAGRPAVLVLYRGAWCPHCNLALRTYQDTLLPELQRRGLARHPDADHRWAVAP